jgi:elongation factor 1-beta
VWASNLFSGPGGMFLNATVLAVCMAKAVVTVKIMPDQVEADLEAIEREALEHIASFTGNDETKTEIEPVAFGLKAIKITFVMDESQGGPDELEKKIQAMQGVMSCETVDVRRAIG